jgi:hypothetical protein
VKVALREPTKACVDVAAKPTHIEVRSQGEQRRAATKARRAHHCALGELVERAGPADRVARVGALGHGQDHETARQLRGHVLGRVHGQIDLTGKQRLLDLLDEAGLVRELRGGASACIAGGRDRHELYLARESLGHPACLGERQCASARA